MFQPCTTHVPPMCYTCSTHMLPMCHPCVNHVSSHVPPMCYTCVTHAPFTRCPCDYHALTACSARFLIGNVTTLPSLLCVTVPHTMRHCNRTRGLPAVPISLHKHSEGEKTDKIVNISGGTKEGAWGAFAGGMGKKYPSHENILVVFLSKLCSRRFRQTCVT